MNWLLRTALAAVLLGVATPGAQSPAQAALEVGAYVPSEAEVRQLVERLQFGMPVRAVPIDAAPFDAAADYRVGEYELAVSASIMPSVSDARRFFDEVTETMESDNERMRMLDNQTLSAYYGADDFRGYRLIHAHPDTGARVSNYAKLIRIGRVVALVEGIGSPETEDADLVDNDRGLITEWLFQLVLGRVRWSPPDPIGKPVAGIEPFAQTWVRHGFGLQLNPHARGEAGWRVYRWCSDDPRPPCDATVGSQILSGGHAFLVFFYTEGDEALGVVVDTSDPGLLSLGPVTLTLKPYGMAALEQLDRAIVVCGPEYPRLAPREMREAMPCGA